jgi:hypothetical protein
MCVFRVTMLPTFFKDQRDFHFQTFLIFSLNFLSTAQSTPGKALSNEPNIIHFYFPDSIRPSFDRQIWRLIFSAEYHLQEKYEANALQFSYRWLAKISINYVLLICRETIVNQRNIFEIEIEIILMVSCDFSITLYVHTWVEWAINRFAFRYLVERQQVKTSLTLNAEKTVSRFALLAIFRFLFSFVETSRVVKIRYKSKKRNILHSRNIYVRYTYNETT